MRKCEKLFIFRCSLFVFSNKNSVAFVIRAYAGSRIGPQIYRRETQLTSFICAHPLTGDCAVKQTSRGLVYLQQREKSAGRTNHARAGQFGQPDLKMITGRQTALGPAADNK